MNKLLITTALVTLFSTGNAWADRLSVGIDKNATLTKEDSTSMSNNEYTSGAAVLNQGTLTIENTEFNNNTATTKAGGAIWSNKNVIINGGKFNKNTATTSGGAIYNSEGILTITDTVFTNNSATTYGGAIGNTSGTLTITDAVFTNNSATSYGGAISSTGTTVIKGGKFIGNSTKFIPYITKDKNNRDVIVYKGGGAIFIDAELTIDGTQFIDNHADEHATVGDRELGGMGGAIYIYSLESTNIKNATFTGNTAYTGGGAIYSVVGSGDLTIANSTFTKNISANAGAVGIFANADLKSVVFNENKATSATGDGGGAVFFGAKSQTTMDDVTFTDNISASHGGAISMRLGDVADNSAAKLDITNSSFKGNIADTDGGAIYSTFYNSSKASQNVYIGNTSFTANQAANGGAIYVYGKVDKGNNYASMKLENTTFTDNTAKTEGGALYNSADATVNFAGANIFSGNTAGGKANDIHNLGIVNVDGDLTLDGGVSGTGSMTFAKGSSLTVTAGKTEIANKVTNNGASLNLIIQNGWTDGEYKLITGSLDEEFSDYNNNNLYDIQSVTNGTYSIVKKSSEAIAAATGADNNHLNVINALISGASGSGAFGDVADKISALLQNGKNGEGIAAVKALAPSIAPLVHKTQTETSNQVFGAVSTRLTGGSISAGNSISASVPVVPTAAAEEKGLASGDEPKANKDAAFWMQGLVGQSKLGSTAHADGFRSDNYGAAFGLEKFFNPSFKAGAGYAYNTSDIDGFMRQADVDTVTALFYGEYKPSNWFINGIATYSWSKYDEHKNVAETSVRGKYDVDTIALFAMTGYDIHIDRLGITPEAGVRYMNIKQDGYYDSLGIHYSGNKSDIVTGVIGIKLSKLFVLDTGSVFKPEIRLAATYDVQNDKARSVVMLPNGAAYQVKGEALERFGWEIGAGLTSELSENTEMSVGYEGRFRTHYQDHSGLVNIKYMF